jgi:hypothetical protein
MGAVVLRAHGVIPAQLSDFSAQHALSCATFRAAVGLARVEFASPIGGLKSSRESNDGAES